MRMSWIRPAIRRFPCATSISHVISQGYTFLCRQRHQHARSCPARRVGNNNVSPPGSSTWRPAIRSSCRADPIRSADIEYGPEGSANRIPPTHAGSGHQPARQPSEKRPIVDPRRLRAGLGANFNVVAMTSATPSSATTASTITTGSGAEPSWVAAAPPRSAPAVATTTSSDTC